VCLYVRRRNILPLTIATAVTAAAVFVAVDRNESDRSGTAASPSPATTASAARETILASVATSTAAPRATLSTAAIDAAVGSLPTGEQLVGSVVDVMSGRTLWAQGARTPMAPASTTKLLTACAALQALGADSHFTTETKELGDTVYLVGGGDPTLVGSAESPFAPGYPQPATLADLAQATAAGLPAGVPVRLRVDTSAWSGPGLAEGWSPDYVTEGDVTPPSALELDGGRLHPDNFDSERTPTPTAQAVSAFEELLRADGVRIKGDVKAATAPDTATPLAEVSSPPLSALVQRLLTASDNDLAEALGRAVAAHDGLSTDFTGAATAVTREAANLGVQTGSVILKDTSGLSHDDRLDAAALVTVLRAAASPEHPVLRSVLDGLPIGGFTGTLADRYLGHGAKSGAGLVRAKTGTLVGVNSLAGVVVDAGGRLIAFAFLAAGQGTEAEVEQGLDRITSALAGLGAPAGAGTLEP
jgi:D-alanyl-D-alanine carboxypeptidase/D-alanyl-D-alanine-endopeptidase (penicillin-binding protein 4)